ncbi:MAG: hypothetical protein F6K62_02415 [Sphaerospermopsis sp. SIO1G2]|nr:hypothetical protein [Sphaerospermopsis sp. SIO1G2]
MKLKNVFVSASLVIGSCLSMNTAAQAASFTTNFTPADPDSTEDIFLESITQHGKTISHFSFVESV